MLWETILSLLLSGSLVTDEQKLANRCDGGNQTNGLCQRQTTRSKGNGADDTENDDLQMAFNKELSVDKEKAEARETPDTEQESRRCRCSRYRLLLTLGQEGQNWTAKVDQEGQRAGKHGGIRGGSKTQRRVLNGAPEMLS